MDINSEATGVEVKYNFQNSITVILLSRPY
jgi:hypothetical protein